MGKNLNHLIYAYSTMRTLIIEDSQQDTLNLRELLASIPAVEDVAMAHTLDAARTALKEARPDIVFLDIELGSHSGLDLLSHIHPDTRIIFTTVHTGFGPQAFDANATDYIVKPVTEERLLRALAKLKFTNDPADTVIQVYRGGSQRFTISLATMAAVVADRDHTIVYCGSRCHPDHRRFGEWLKLTASHPFTQLDRSTIVRKDLVLSWIPYGPGLKLRFHNSSQELELGRAAAKRFLDTQ